MRNDEQDGGGAHQNFNDDDEGGGGERRRREEPIIIIRDDLFSFAERNDYKGLERLIGQQECSPDDKDDFGRTALHIASYHGHEESTAKLISLGASLNIPDFESGWTALHRALYHGHLKVSLLLIKAGKNESFIM